MIKQPLGMHVMVGKILRVELHGKDAASILGAHGLNDAVLSAAINLKAVGGLLDRLMVHAVGLYFGRAGDTLKDAPLFKANGMHRLAERRLLLMRFFRNVLLGFDILDECAAHATLST